MKKLILAFLLFGAIVGGGLYFQDSLKGLVFRTAERVARLESLAPGELLEEIGERILTSSPLRGPETGANSYLTQEGVVRWTNTMRIQNGLKELSTNVKLDAAAKAKVDDMFLKGYFAHESPDGKGPGDLAKAAEYSFIMVGENLALGNFEDDRALVQAWMDSPGHRANILHERFTEIGVAVRKGMFEGKETWLVVQEFGLPSSFCPQPDGRLRARISEDEARLTQTKVELDAEGAALSEDSARRSPDYRTQVEAYNERVRAYNDFVAETKSRAAAYNGQVRAFNECIQASS